MENMLPIVGEALKLVTTGGDLPEGDKEEGNAVGLGEVLGAFAELARDLAGAPENTAIFLSKGDAALHRGTRMGSYTKTSQIIQGSLVFEQVDKQKDEEQHYLFVGPDGCWRVGPDVTSYSGSVLKHPEKYAELPPYDGWLYYLDDKWNEDESLKVKVNVPEEKDVEEDTLIFASKGDAGLHQKNRMGNYIKTIKYREPLIIRGCPVFEQDKKQEDGKQHYLFVGPDDLWRVGPDYDSNSDSVLKHPEKHAKFPPRNGWLYYFDDKWNEDQSLHLTVTGKEEVVTFESSGDAGDHRKTRMGSYIKTLQKMRGCPVFEQVEKTTNEKQHYLFVGPDGRWRVGPDVTSYSGSVLKHPEKNAENPPKIGWLYYLNDTWNKDDSLQLITKEDDAGVSQAKASRLNKIPRSCDCTIMEKFEVEDNYGTKEVKYVTCLGIAILKSDIEAVESSLRKGCDINFDKMEYGSHIGFTPLILACRWSSLDVVSLLLKHPGIEIDKRNDDGETALACAVRRYNNVDLVKLLVEAGAKIHLRDGQGYSHLHRAVEAESLENVKYLHSKGASLHTHAKGRTTPLWKAVDEQNLEMVRYLVENGASLDAPRCFYGFNPFHMAVKHAHVEMVKYMIEQGADVAAKTTQCYCKYSCDCGGQRTSIEIAQKEIEELKCRWNQIEELYETPEENEEDKKKYEEIISMLEASEKVEEVVETSDSSIVEEFQLPDVDDEKLKNVSSLGMAILQDDIKAVETSLAKGCDVNFDKTEYWYRYYKCGGWTPLMLACRWSSLPVVSMLVAQPGIKLNRVNEYEEAALAWAVKREDNLDMVKLLVEAGADPDMRCKDGYSHLHRAANSGQLETVKYLQSCGATINTKEHSYVGLISPLWQAASDGNLEMVKYLASEGASLDTPKGLNGYSPLNTAVANANVDVVKFLIEQGADVDQESEPRNVNWTHIIMSNLEIALRETVDGWNRKDKKLYPKIIEILREAGAKETDIKKLILETLNAIMWIWVEKIGIMEVPRWTWPCDGRLPPCLRKLKLATLEPEVWISMACSLVDVIPLDHPLGPIAVVLLIKNTPMPKMYEIANDIFSKLLDLAASFEANDRRHANISLVISSIVGVFVSEENWCEYTIKMLDLILNPAMLDYLFGNLISGATPETAIFSLLALILLTKKIEDCENPKAEIVKKRFSEFIPAEHPLLRIEKLVDSDNFSEKQAGFCAQWCLNNVWPIDNPEDAESRKMIDNTNINVRLIPCNESKWLKFGPSGLEVRSDGPWFETARSSLQVEEGCWYYEVTIFTGGLMQIGWATNQSMFLENKGYGVGDDEFGVSYDGARQVVWYDKTQPDDFTHSEPKGWAPEGQGVNSWKPGDVVGAFIDIENKEIVFSLNGVNIREEPYKESRYNNMFEFFKEDKNGFCAAVSLMSFQQCQLNFGRDPFKYVPEGRTFKPLNEACIKSS